MRIAIAAVVAIGIACVSFDLEGRRFRCDGVTNTCDPGFACNEEGYCAPVESRDGGPNDASNDGALGEICNNGIDDDGDGRIDCADTECPDATTCGAGCLCNGNGPTELACADGIDNDNDDAVDCNDTDCPGCQGALMCCPDGACRTSC
jgi:hypothetical protein